VRGQWLERTRIARKSRDEHGKDSLATTLEEQGA
jgi:hypothetical protein